MRSTLCAEGQIIRTGRDAGHSVLDVVATLTNDPAGRADAFTVAIPTGRTQHRDLLMMAATSAPVRLYTDTNGNLSVVQSRTGIVARQPVAA